MLGFAAAGPPDTPGRRRKTKHHVRHLQRAEVRILDGRNGAKLWVFHDLFNVIDGADGASPFSKAAITSLRGALGDPRGHHLVDLVRMFGALFGAQARSEPAR